MQRLGSSSKLHGVPPVRPCSSSIAELASCRIPSPVDRGLELTEDMDAVDCLLNASPEDPNASASAHGEQGASALLELTPVIPLGASINCSKYEDNSPTLTPLKRIPQSLELGRCPVSSSTANRRPRNLFTPSGLAIGQQELPGPHEKFRLPNHDCLSPMEGEPPMTLERYSVTVKPKNTNFRSRYSLPSSTSRRTVPIDLLTEIQTADSSFPMAGISPASEATSYQVSEIGADNVDRSPDQVTITTSTSTIKPNHSISIDDFDRRLKIHMIMLFTVKRNARILPCNQARLASVTPVWLQIVMTAAHATWSPLNNILPPKYYLLHFRVSTADMTESDLSWARRSASELEVRDYYTLTSPSEGEMDSSSSESYNLGDPSKPKLMPSCFEPVHRKHNTTLKTCPDSCRT
ncbi:unnamed protein product [Dibothriocephalus latus]|uniref:Uncharacterized protein n=1 Tax=Dibothriocephalus latus TaxID=60516 RepID=A0A3P7NWF3_DIBLA|nr:unnamed protein product [Dibothriocephalus latus]